MEQTTTDREQSTTAALSNAMVRVVKSYTGRGPTKARTLYGQDMVICLMQDTLTTSERTLVNAGEARTVLDSRHRIQEAMRDDAVAVVEEITDRKVVAFMSDNHIDPDMAVESFVLEPEPDAGTGPVAT